MILAGLVGGLVGARLDFIVENNDWSRTTCSATSLRLRSGLVRRRDRRRDRRRALGVVRAACSKPALLDLCAAPLALGYAIGRIGCQLSGDGDYGEAWDGPGRWHTPTGPSPPARRCTRRRSTRPLRWASPPLPLEAPRPLPAGILFAIYLILAGVERFLVEFIRSQR